jgi:hypothetical protein
VNGLPGGQWHGRRGKPRQGWLGSGLSLGRDRVVATKGEYTSHLCAGPSLSTHSACDSVLVVAELASRQEGLLPVSLALDSDVVVGLSGAVLEQRDPEVLSRVVDPLSSDQAGQFVIPTVAGPNVAAPSCPYACIPVGRTDMLLAIVPVYDEIDALDDLEGGLPIWAMCSERLPPEVERGFYPGARDLECRAPGMPDD